MKRKTNDFIGIKEEKINNKSIWKANITYEKEVIFIGEYEDPIMAAKAYDKKAMELYGHMFGRLNFPEDWPVY
jgi:hypothetical protein